jgi:hypothetical protein
MATCLYKLGLVGNYPQALLFSKPNVATSKQAAGASVQKSVGTTNNIL